MNLIILIVLYLIFSTAGLMLLKKSVIGADFISFQSYIQLLWNAKFVCGFFLYAFSFVVWIFLLSKKDLSYIFPIVVGLGYVLIMLAAVLILKENFTINKVFGAMLVGAGIILIFASK